MPTLTLEQALELAWTAYHAGRFAEAESLCRQMLVHQETSAGAHQLLGLVLCQNGNLSGGIASLQRAVDLDPANAAIRNNFATVLSRADQPQRALAHLQEAVVLNPRFPEAHYNIANLYREAGEYSKAMDAYRRAIQFKPDFPQAQNNLANALKDCGQATEALKVFRDLLSLHPNPRIGSNYVCSMHFEPDVEPRRLLVAHRQWNDDYAAALTAAAEPHRHVDFTTIRKLRIGYVSPDFRNHPVGRFILPLIKHHDSERFEITCYSDVVTPDSMTGRLRSASHRWRDTRPLNDEQLAQQIRADSIDILVDLTMHLDGSRLLAFARRPAPVQATYLAYCSTTGLSAMDYRISDPHLDPPDVDESLYSERTVRLKHCYWCYDPPVESPEITPNKNDGVVFGCLNNFGKVNAGVIAVWSEILLRVDSARLILFAHAGDHRARATQQFAEHHVDPSRVSFVGVQSIDQYMNQHQRIDIALDPFPYPGGTTSCDALWMGTPVVTLAGLTPLSRGGESILKTIGLPQLINHTREAYVDCAVTLAGQPDRLATLRTGLRARMRGSALMNASQFARDMENVFTQMWTDSGKRVATIASELRHP